MVPLQARNPTQPLKQRIREAAFSTFMEKGYAGTNTREIAARAKVSKRELYALYEDKQAMLADCIRFKSERARQPLPLEPVQEMPALRSALEAYGTSFLTELTKPTVVAVYRLAVLEAHRSPEVVRTLNALGKEANTQNLARFLRQAQKAKLLAPGNPTTIARQFTALLWGDTMLSLLLGSEGPPSPQDARKRAREAVRALLRLYGLHG